MIPYHLSHQWGSRLGAKDSGGLTVRGVVTRVYAPDDPLRRLLTVTPPGWVCDVLVYDPPFRTELREVPISMASAGLNDAEVWKPRAATISLVPPGTLLTNNDGTVVPSAVTAAENMDGDHVLVTFLNNDMSQPIIIGQLPHPKSNRSPSIADIPAYKYKRTTRGVTWGVTDSGDVKLNTTASSGGAIGPTGDEVPTAPISGQIGVTLAAGQKVTIADSVLSAPAAALLGSNYLTSRSTLLTAESTYRVAEATFLSALSAFVTTTSTATTAPQIAAAGVTLLPAVAAFLTAQATYTAALTVFSGEVTTSLGVGLPHLSSHLDLD